MKKIVALFILCASVVICCAQIRLPKVIGSNMVLQQNKPVAIWGYAMPSSDVKVYFGKQGHKTQADDNGKWMVYLKPMKANKAPQKMIIKSAGKEVVLENILVGEVWLASGQSNMQYTMMHHPGYLKPQHGEDIQQQEVEKASLPLMRMLYVGRNLNTDTLYSSGWKEINKESIQLLSAAGYFFGKTLTDSLNIPVGIISASWGGTMIETWTPEQAYLDSPYFKGSIDNGRMHNTDVGYNFEHMVRKIIPFTLKGFIWYQGESNITAGYFDEYAEMQKILINSWRTLWGDLSLPFYYVQVAPHIYSQRRGDRYVNTWESLPRFREKQAECMQIPYTGMAVTTDLVDDLNDIHPPYKWEVGRRLALWALAHDYNYKNLVYSGPRYKSMQVDGNKIILSFEFVGSGLVASDGKDLNWFQIAGDDNHFYDASAVIENDKVIVSSHIVKHPVNVRFAWDEVAQPNFYNKEGLPAIPFRTNGNRK